MKAKMRKRDVKGSSLVAVASVLAGLLLVGCGPTGPAAKPSPTGPKTNGIEKLSVSKIIDKAVQAAGEADMLHAAGKGEENGSEVELDVRIKPGKGGVGYVIQDGLRMDIIILEDAIYLKADKEYWTKYAGAQAAAVIGDKWAKASAKQKDFADLVAMFDAEKSVKQYLTYTGGLPRKGKPEKLEGQLVLPLVDRNGAKAYIALTGEPRLVEVVDEDGHASTFKYDETFTLEVPPAKNVFELNQ
jgi:hypothetical protein